MQNAKLKRQAVVVDTYLLYNIATEEVPRTTRTETPSVDVYTKRITYMLLISITSSRQHRKQKR